MLFIIAIRFRIHNCFNTEHLEKIKCCFPVFKLQFLSVFLSVKCVLNLNITF